jgi:uncharacterized protein YfaS (alpha-2-macroglobulin family)
MKCSFVCVSMAAALGAFALQVRAAEPTSTPAAVSAQVQHFSPQDTTRQVRQVTARFSTPMVALGDPRLPDPFRVDCAVSGKGRWADGRNWVYDFDADLPAGLECRFTLNEGLKDLGGRPVESQRTFKFDTGGPAIIASFPQDGWEVLDEEQIFLLKLDAPATAGSVTSHAYCVIDGLAERVPLKVLTGQERRDVLAQRAALGYAYYRLLWKDGYVSGARVRDRTLEQAEDVIVVATCNRRLPSATKVNLVWGAGVAAASGLATRQDQQLAFRVRPAFTAQVECARTNADAGCIPFQAITIRFTAPVPQAKVRAAFLKSADGTIFRPAPSEMPKAPTVEQVMFAGPFPDSGNLTVSLPRDLVDDAGRPLDNAARFPLKLTIDEYPPLAKFSGDFGILEAGEGGVLPVTLRNVEAELPVRQATLPGRVLSATPDLATVADWMRRVEKANHPAGEWQRDENTGKASWREVTGLRSVFEANDAPQSFTLTKPLGKRPSEVVGIPLGKPGFYVIELESRVLGASLLGRDEPRHVSTAALVTNLSVHFLWGRESSQVWVTRLDDGSPVADAAVTVGEFCGGGTRWQGHTDAKGLATIETTLGQPHDGDNCEYSAFRPLMVTAQTSDDFSFTVSSWSRGITQNAFGLSGGSWHGADIYHTVLDRPLFRAGETVSMKHFIRRHRMQGIDLVEQLPGTRKVTISHEGSEQRYVVGVSFDANGVAEQSWEIPKEAKLGDYAISIEDPSSRGHSSGRFKVEEYRLPTMRATVLGPARPLVNASEATLDLHVAYLAGGGASGLPVTLRSVVEPRALQFPGYEDFQFGGTAVVEGIVESSGSRWDYDFEREEQTDVPKARVTPLTLDAQGAARVTIPDLPAIAGPAQLVAELEYADANGELLTSTGRVRLLPSEVSLGIRRESWVASTDQLRFRVVALDLDGKPIARQLVSVALYQAIAYSYRKRLIGGFYAYETVRETKQLRRGCNGRTNAQGLLICDIKPGVSGEIILRAETRDSQANAAGATASIWVAGKDDWWFGGTVGDRMDVLPEQKEYESGQLARFQVRMPFRSATALVSVEREGVIESFVTTLKGEAPIVEVPIKDNYSPNVYVSVLAVRGRVARSERSKAQRTKEGADVTALVDLNKPAYRLGVAEIRVGWRPHRLNVRVTTERTTYRVREKTAVKIQVVRADGTPLPAGTEVAIAAVDEALLELAPSPSWALLDAMMGQRALEVVTSTAQSQVVGKRHFGRKAVPHGGGGGRERARELFESLLVWLPRVVLDANGEATVSVPLNDSLTSFRIAAIAHGGTQLFGTGSASIATTQELILLSGLPPLVREGDQYSATFTLRNTTDQVMNVDVDATLTPASAKPLKRQRVEISGGQARDIVWKVVAPVGASELKWVVKAQQVGGAAVDRVNVGEKVIPAYPVRTYQATIAQLTGPYSVPSKRPRAAIPGRGGLDVSLRARLGDGLDGVREYMSFYSYICLEQNLSRAVALRNQASWDGWMKALPSYMDRDGLLRYFPSEWLDGEDVLTAYVLAIANEAGWEIPETTRRRLIAALTGFVEGRIVRQSALPTADLAIRKLAAIDALSRYNAASASMLDSITIEPNLWPTSAVIDWIGILRRVQGIQQANQLRSAAEGILRARLHFQGTTMGFSTSRADALWWLMISEDSNAVRMLLAVLDEQSWREDIPRLVRGALGRQQRGHWRTTVANAWGVLAMEKFSAAFESTPVTGATAMQYGRTQKSVTWPQERGVASLELPWRDDAASLDVNHAGTGKPWIMVRATAALPLVAPVSTGFKIVRTVTPVTQQLAGRWSRGDVARVRLELEAQSDMSWVVVEDPVPGGATVLGTGLGAQSNLLQRGERREGWTWPAFEERKFDSFRAYYRFVPKGKWTVEYTVRLNNPGTFMLPATRVEAMYAPEMLGELPNAAITVEAAQ